MKLSVIVPVYRAEKYLRRCVESLLGQTQEESEIILINDGSPDASLTIMEEYSALYPDRVRIRSIENGGQGRARNIGLSMARGEYIGFVDSDDWVEPGMYETMLRAAEREEAELVVCDFRNCFSDGRIQEQSLWREDHPLASAGSVCNKLFRADLIREIRFPEGVWYEDLEFSARALLRARRIVHVQEALYDYRIGHSSTMNNDNAGKNLDILRVLEGIRKDMEQLGTDRGEFEYLLINHVLLDSVNRLSLQHSPDKLEAISRLRAYVREQIPDLRACESWQKESRNRRIVMKMNYLGLEDLSRLLLDLKKTLRR